MPTRRSPPPSPRPPPDVGEAAARLRRALGFRPDAVVVLGSGLGGLADRVEDAVRIPFTDLPGFPPSGVAGHAGRYVGGTLGGRRVVLQAGRYHFYEGHPREVVAAPVRLAAALGASTLILTNAAGGVGPRFAPGSIVLLDDHIDLMFRAPLAGAVVGAEERFPDMSAPYDPEIQALALAVAREEGIALERGTYAAVTGPSYETAAEVRMLRRLGADVIGMSTVPEVIVARASGMRCLALSLVTNAATGLSGQVLSHEEVVEAGRASAERMTRMLTRIIAALPAASGEARSG